MKPYEINPHLRYARVHKPTKMTKDLSCCYDCRLFYFLKGSGRATVGDENYQFSKNSALFIPPGSRYRFTLQESSVMLVLNFDLNCDHAHLQESLGTVPLSSFEPEKVVHTPLPEDFSRAFCRYAPRIYEPLKQCTDEFLLEDPYFRETASALLKYALMELIRTPRGTASGTVAAVTDYIRLHYADAALNNSRIAEKLGYHPYHLSALMKRSTGRTLHESLLEHRIRIAKDLLLTTELDVNTVAWKCGFNSTAYFIKQFKTRVGTTPKQYSKNSNI